MLPVLFFLLFSLSFTYAQSTPPKFPQKTLAVDG